MADMADEDDSRTASLGRKRIREQEDPEIREEGEFSPDASPEVHSKRQRVNEDGNGGSPEPSLLENDPFRSAGRTESPARPLSPTRSFQPINPPRSSASSSSGEIIEDGEDEDGDSEQDDSIQINLDYSGLDDTDEPLKHTTDNAVGADYISLDDGPELDETATETAEKPTVDEQDSTGTEPPLGKLEKKVREQATTIFNKTFLKRPTGKNVRRVYVEIPVPKANTIASAEGRNPKKWIKKVRELLCRHIARNGHKSLVGYYNRNQVSAEDANVEVLLYYPTEQEASNAVKSIQQQPIIIDGVNIKVKAEISDRKVGNSWNHAPQHQQLFIDERNLGVNGKGDGPIRLSTAEKTSAISSAAVTDASSDDRERERINQLKKERKKEKRAERRAKKAKEKEEATKADMGDSESTPAQPASSTNTIHETGQESKNERPANGANGVQESAPTSDPLFFSDTGPRVRISQLSHPERELQARYWHKTDPNEYVRCPICSVEGHMDEVCPSRTCKYCQAVDQHFSNACPSRRKCTKCRERGHTKENCSSKLSRSRADGFQCDLCNHSGHVEENCDFIWRTFVPDDVLNLRKVQHLNMSCYQCGGRDHWGDDCRKGAKNGRVNVDVFSAKEASRYLMTPLTEDVRRNGNNGFSIRGQAEQSGNVRGGEDDEITFMGSRPRPQPQRGNNRRGRGDLSSRITPRDAPVPPYRNDGRTLISYRDDRSRSKSPPPEPRYGGGYNKYDSYQPQGSSYRNRNDDRWQPPLPNEPVPPLQRRGQGGQFSRGFQPPLPNEPPPFPRGKPSRPYRKR